MSAVSSSSSPKADHAEVQTRYDNEPLMILQKTHEAILLDISDSLQPDIGELPEKQGRT